MSNAVAKYEDRKAVSTLSPSKINAIIPANRNEISEFSADLMAAGMVPGSYNKGTPKEIHAKLCMCITKGLEIGMPPMMSLQSIYIINNIPAIYGDGAIALVQRSGKIEWMRETIEGKHGTDDWAAICEIKRVDQDVAYRRSFSFGQAKRAKLATKPGPWMAYPERMLQMRARALALRDGFADVLCGLGIAEEVADIPVRTEHADTAFLDDDAADVPAITDQSVSDDATEMEAGSDEKPSEKPASSGDQSEKPKIDPNTWAEKYITSVKACTTMDQVNGLHNGHIDILNKYEENHPEIWQRMRDAEDDRIVELENQKVA
ncbi:hypothetical protein [Thalassospira xiamenensis]|uniref:hypothetical protein n=1 Tax=Thalassospira xiamenensis TaxID=220697 RepID=UPI003AA7C23C